MEFHLMQILGLLGMYFHAVLLFVTSYSLLFRLALAILCHQNTNTESTNPGFSLTKKDFPIHNKPLHIGIFFEDFDFQNLLRFKEKFEENKSGFLDSEFVRQHITFRNSSQKCPQQLCILF